VTEYIKILGNNNSGRCLATAFGVNGKKVLNLVSVYLPRIEASVQYSVGECLEFTEDILHYSNEAEVFGDFNFECDIRK
jgi:hypothetical protein